MEKFTWKEEYSVGIPSIDKQHKHFFALTNEAIGLSTQLVVSQEGLRQAADQLGNYALYHLKTEEDYFDKVAYPEAPAHIEAHNSFRRQLGDYSERIEKVEKGGSSLAELQALAKELASYAIYWLSHHILLVDKKYTHYFQEHGIQ